MTPTHRQLFFIAALACAGMMAFSLYLQEVVKLEPCPLCIVQRVFMIAIGVVALLAALHNPSLPGRRLYAGLLGLLAIGGGAAAMRQVWLQHLPADRVPECGPSLDYMLDAFPLSETLQLVFRGSGQCAKVDWTFLSFSIAEWTLLVFTGFLIFAGVVIFNKTLASH